MIDKLIVVEFLKLRIMIQREGKTIWKKKSEKTKIIIITFIKYKIYIHVKMNETMWKNKFHASSQFRHHNINKIEKNLKKKKKKLRKTIKHRKIKK